MTTNAITLSNVDSDDRSQATHYAILVDASGLPEEARHLILQTIRQTRLSSEEQACVAEELIAHFADGLDSGESIEDMVDAFGDSKTTATLIRRAKQRGWLQPRFVNIAAQAGMGFLILLCLGLCSFLFIFITPKLQALYATSGMVLPDYLQWTISVADFINQYFFMILLLVVAAIGLFEWKCKVKYKTMFRSGILIDLCVASGASVIWAAGAHIVCIIDLAIWLTQQTG